MTRQFLLQPDTGPGFRYEAADVLMLVTVEEEFYLDFALGYFVAAREMATDIVHFPQWIGIATTLPGALIRVDLVQEDSCANYLQLVEGWYQSLKRDGWYQLPFDFGKAEIDELRGDPDLADYTGFELLFKLDSMEITDGTIWASLPREALR